jgi:hypothetical protein
MPLYDGNIIEKKWKTIEGKYWINTNLDSLFPV